MAAPVMGDDAIAVLEEEQHLGVPVVGRQGPAVAEHDGLTASPVLVEDLRAIRRRDRAHVVLPSCRCWFPHVLGLPSLVGPGLASHPPVASATGQSCPADAHPALRLAQSYRLLSAPQAR